MDICCPWCGKEFFSDEWGDFCPRCGAEWWKEETFSEDWSDSWWEILWV